MKRVWKKLRSGRGESIAEVLVALLISAVALVLLASMISVSSSLVKKSRTAMEEYDEAGNRLNAMAAPEPGATGDEGKIKLTMGGDEIKLTPDQAINAIDGSISVYWYENTETGDTVIAYRLK